MRYGIISDIHGNLEALEAAIDALSREKVDKYLCVGDIVGYGADPVECIKKTRTLTSVIVCGNHDAASSGLIGTAYFNEMSKEAVVWTRNNLTKENIAFLKTLGLVYKNEDLTLVHGTLQEPGAFHYMFNGNSASLTFRLLETPICFVGHSHSPGVFAYKDGDIKYFYDEKIRAPKYEKLIVNVGSVGQPRDRDPRLCYSIYDTEKKLIELKRLPYDVEKAQEKILNTALPAFLAYRLSEGM